MVCSDGAAQQPRYFDAAKTLNAAREPVATELGAAKHPSYLQCHQGADTASRPTTTKLALGL